MAPESVFCAVALMMNLLAMSARSGGQNFQGLARTRPSAFRTDRLSPRGIKLWHAIRKVVLAQDPHGRPSYPTLYGLWCAVEQSGHLIFIELNTDKERVSNIAGETVIENYDPRERMHSIRVRLFIPTIDRVYAGEQAPQDGLEFVPFAGLRHERRYAKALGHELAHVEKMLRDPDYLHLLQKICTEQSAIAAAVGSDRERLSLTALQERWDRIWPLVLESEKPALAAEAEIRRELLARQ